MTIDGRNTCAPVERALWNGKLWPIGVHDHFAMVRGRRLQVDVCVSFSFRSSFFCCVLTSLYTHASRVQLTRSLLLVVSHCDGKCAAGPAKNFFGGLNSSDLLIFQGLGTSNLVRHLSHQSAENSGCQKKKKLKRFMFF